ncbi:TPA: LysR family transcriptional regulator, partial [Streptococcus agalactiae]
DVIDIVYIRHDKANLSKMGQKFIDYLLEEVSFNHKNKQS